MKTHKLTDIALDWAVAKCIGTLPSSYDDWTQVWPKYSSSWSCGGHIVESERICIDIDSSGVWLAYIKQNYSDTPEFMNSGSTPLEAAMRCFVASKLGNDVDVPLELLA